MRLPAAFCGSGRTRKWPCANFAAQSGLYGVVFNVMNYALLLGGISHPAVKVFPAPECACSSQQAIRLLRAGHFDSRDYLGQVTYRADQRVNVVRHHDPAAKFVKSTPLSSEQGGDHGTRYIGLDQPLWAGCSRIQNLIEGDEFSAFRCPEVRYALYR